MTTTEEQELQALRERAYGPGGGLTPEAIRRLQELEDARRPPVLSRVVELEAVEQPAETLPPVEAPESPGRLEAAARWVLDRLERLRRRTVLIALGVAVLLTAVVVALTVVQRVQTGPLQAGAEEVARLSVDPTYEIPRLFANSADGAIPEAFESFHGVRPVVVVGGFFTNSAEECLNVFVEADIVDPQSDSFSGQVMSGCGARGFPAVTQFPASVDGFPAELREAFPDVALQFVHDIDSREIVVYASPLDS